MATAALKQTRDPGALANAQTALRAGDVDTVAALLPDACRAKPAMAVRMMKLLEKHGLQEFAAESFPLLVSSFPDDEEVRAHASVLSGLLVARAKAADAPRDQVRGYRLALAVEPGNKRALAGIAAVVGGRLKAAVAARRHGSTDEAIGFMESVLGVDPDNLTALKFLGVALDESGRRPEAAAHVARAIALDPSDVALLRRHVSLQEDLGNLDVAFAALVSMVSPDAEPQTLAFVASRAERLAGAFSREARPFEAARAALLARKAGNSRPALDKVVAASIRRIPAAVRAMVAARDVEGVASAAPFVSALLPDDTVLLSYVAKFLTAKQSFGAAGPIWKSLRDKGVTGFDVESGTAQVLAAQGDGAGAIRHALAALAAKPGDVAMTRLVTRLASQR